MSKNDAINRLNNSKLDANKTPVEVIKENPFGRICFKDIYSSVNGKWCRTSGKEFDKLKSINQKYYCSNFNDVSVNELDVKCETSSRFWENNGWINSINTMIGFSGILDTF